jgi:hypothetical protein
MAKPQKRRTTNLLTLPTADQLIGTADSDIARRAYELYLRRGGDHGHDLDDWLQAERQLRDAARSTAA